MEARQLEAVDSEIELQRKLRERLMRVLEAPTTVTLIEAIEVTTMIEKLHAWATGNARQPGGGTRCCGDRAAAWVKLIGEIERERAAGTDPADPRVRQLLERVDALIEAFTGGDARIRASLERTYKEEGPEKQIVRIEWDSAEGHLQGFRQSADFKPFLEAIGPFYGDIEEMTHYQVTATR